MEDEKSNTLTPVLVAFQNTEMEFYLPLSLPPPHYPLPGTGLGVFLILRHKPRCAIFSLQARGVTGGPVV